MDIKPKPISPCAMLEYLEKYKEDVREMMTIAVLPNETNTATLQTVTLPSSGTITQLDGYDLYVRRKGKRSFHKRKLPCVIHTGDKIEFRESEGA